MSGYKTFAVWGAGNQGSPIVKALLAEPSVSSVKVLTRPQSTNKPEIKDLESLGATIVPFDVSSEDSKAAAASLKDIDVLISTTGGPGLPLQSKMIHLAQSAGVKLFVLAEWSMDGVNRNTATDKLKTSIREEAARIGLPTAAFWPGLWIDFFPMLGWDLQNGKITIRGDGRADVSVTSLDDVAAYAVHVLTELPRETLEGGKFYIEAERIKFYDLALQLQKASSKPVEIVCTGRAELEEKMAANPDDPVTVFFLGWDKGDGVHQSKLNNGLYPDWKPKTAFEVLKAHLPA